MPKLAALAILRSHSATAAGAGSPFPLISGIGEEAATPGQPARVRTRLRNVPRRFTLENHRLLQALPQSSGKLRKLSRFRCSHSPSQPRPPQHKKSPRLCRNCGRKAFLVETRGKPSAVIDNCHPERSEGPGFLPARPVRVPHVSPLLRDVGIFSSLRAVPRPVATISPLLRIEAALQPPLKKIHRRFHPPQRIRGMTLTPARLRPRSIHRASLAFP